MSSSCSSNALAWRLCNFGSLLHADLDEKVIMGGSWHDFLLYLGGIEGKELQFLGAKRGETGSKFIQSTCYLHPLRMVLECLCQ
jgi:hypothetical protein